MPEGSPLSNLLAQARALPAGRQLTLAVTALGSLAFFMWLAFGGVTSDYRLLYRGLAEDEAAKVLDGLAAEKVAYRLEEGGTAIYVPGSEVHETRIRLARRGLPQGGTGFEIFDQQGFGVTDFVQRVNYRRALQGELGRSVEQLASVDRARVQIALPERNTFLADAGRRASASVVVRIAPGRELEESQVHGIVHLVASSVEGLDPSRVTVVDDRGRMLAPIGDGGPGPTAPAGSMAHQARVERELAERVETILGRTVGVGGVVARVRADMDWTHTEVTEERYDPDSQVARSEQVTTDKTNERSADVGGVPGVFGNQPDVAGGPGAGGQSANSEKSSETINYEINKTVSHVVQPVGTLQRLSVAVLIDGKPAAPGAEGAGFVQWSPEEIAQFEELAKQAVGFDPERGDQITLTSAPFRMLDVEPEGSSPLDFLGPDVMWLVGSVVRALAILLGVLAFARMVVRPVVAAVGSASSGRVPARAGDLEAQLAGGTRAFGELAPPQPTLAEQVGHVAQQRSDDSVKTIRNWLHQR